MSRTDFNEPSSHADFAPRPAAIKPQAGNRNATGLTDAAERVREDAY